jgi:hypothetical protein
MPIIPKNGGAMDSARSVLICDYLRRFGVEIELNAADMRSRPVDYENGALPEGIEYIGNLVRKITNDRALIHVWGHDHNNDIWVIKPDSSCGVEVCTPVLKGWQGLMSCCRVVEGFAKEKLSADERCSVHVHVDVSDLSDFQLACIVTWWVKCEAVFMDSVPPRRKKNHYCQFLGLTDIFDNIEDGFLSDSQLLSKVGHCKYYTLNTFHCQKNNRRTIEFRIMENECSLDPWMVKNWVRLVLHFVERAAVRGMPVEYKQGDAWSGYCWLDPLDVFAFLGFSGEQELSPGFQQVRRWFVSRLKKNAGNTGLSGVMSDLGRSIALAEIDQLYNQFGPEEVVGEEELYGNNFKI